MTDTLIIQAIHRDPDLRNIWDGLPRDAKERVLEEADGDTWHLENILENVVEDYLRSH